jgi:uncharacterized protein YutE (UPF0331/DUF86 family)
MTVDRELIERRLQDLALRVARLRTLRGLSPEAFSADWRNVWLAERGLQTAIQAVIDIGAHILAALGDTDWDEYRAIPTRLAAHGVIPSEAVPLLERMIGLRNILVHPYIGVHVARLHEVIERHLEDFDRWAEWVLTYLSRQTGGPSATG